MAIIYDWSSIRIEYENGKSLNSIHKAFGCSRAAIRKHVLKDDWKKPIAPSIADLSHDELYKQCPKYRFVVNHFWALHKMHPDYEIR